MSLLAATAAVAAPISNTAKTEKYLLTKCRAVVYTHTWKIEDISSKLGTTTVFSSSEFDERSLENREIYLGSASGMSLQLLNKPGDSEAFCTCLGLKFVLSKNSRFAKKLLRCSAWIFDSDGCQTNYITMIDGIFQQLKLSDGATSYCHTFERFVLRSHLLDEKQKLIGEHGDLSIACKVEILETPDQLYIADKYIQPYPEKRENTLLHDMEELFRRGTFSDVTLVDDGHKFNVHRNILATRSPVFRTMFAAQMSEKKEGIINIEDHSAAVIEDMLMYIYTGHSPNIKTLARELLAVGEKYDLPSLKSICEFYLASQVTAENAAELLMIAERYNTIWLKQALLQFVARHGESVMQTACWGELSEAYPKLVEDVLRATAQYVGQLSAKPTISS